MKTWRRKLAETLDLPENALGRCPYLVMEANHAIRIDGCREILAYERQEIRLKAGDLTVTVTGEGLTMRSYALMSVRIAGEIRGVTLEGVQRRKGEKLCC